MDRNFKEVSEDVVENAGQYFVKIDSSRTLEKRFFDDSEYGICCKDIEIQLKRDGHFAEGVCICFSRENNQSEDESLPETSYMDMIVSSYLGTFVSDWY